LFCDSRLGEATKPEHILLNRLGHYAVSLPYVETLSPERSAEIVRKK